MQHLVTFACLYLLSISGAETEDVAPGWSIITVMPGDSAASLAKRFEVTPSQLAKWNGAGLEGLVVGRRLRVFSRVKGEERFRTRVKGRPGMTWRGLARDYGLPLDVLLKLNGRKRGGKVREGRRIKLYVAKSRWRWLRLDGGIQLQSGTGVVVKHPKWAWGRPVTVRTIEEVGRKLAGKFEGSAIVVGDLSKEGGGRFPPHKGHKGGLDADLGLFKPDEPFTVKFKHLKPTQIDAERTWFMLKSFIETGRVDRILVDWRLQSALYDRAKKEGLSSERVDEWLQYPARRWKQKGIIRHYDGHKNHIHIRFKDLAEEGIL